MVANPAPRVVILLAKWSKGPGDSSFYWYIALGVSQLTELRQHRLSEGRMEAAWWDKTGK